MIIKGKILNRAFYNQSTLKVAKELIGCYVVLLSDELSISKSKEKDIIEVDTLNKDVKIARIVETEAYLGFKDKACHSYNQKKEGRTNIMYNEGGYVYVYLIYGLYYCFNVVTQPKGIPEAVLFRALEDILDDNPKKYSGPGKLTKELGITKQHYGIDLTTNPIFFILKPLKKSRVDIISTPRINIDYSGEDKNKPYRFIDKNSKSLSKKMY